MSITYTHTYTHYKIARAAHGPPSSARPSWEARGCCPPRWIYIYIYIYIYNVYAHTLYIRTYITATLD